MARDGFISTRNLSLIVRPASVRSSEGVKLILTCATGGIANFRDRPGAGWYSSILSS